MKINKEFEITTDKDKNYILIQTYKTKVGTYTTKERYYPTLEAALSGCLKQRILQSKSAAHVCPLPERNLCLNSLI